jgi:acylphosphatase
MTPARLHVKVRGRVQGVGFRYFVRSRAKRLGLGGWVKNHHDGSVEIVAVGGEASIERLRGLLADGPIAARVDSVDDVDDGGHEQEPLDPGTFEVRR